jgi:hypothetical protein
MTEAQHPHSSSEKEPMLDGELNVRSLSWLTIGLLVIVAIAVVAMWFFGLGIKDNLIAEDQPPPVLPEARMEHQPPAPNLQVDPRQQLLDLRADAERELTTYGWVDETNGLTRVPIDRAMDLLIEQGLPTPTAVPEAPEEASTGI